ncbi:hypothetical protein Leryth_018298 [Lithospermum erythrorhizon]|nr:hypothetical protein Leryth_018298 [Lithospermum erythrorhizon]
MKFYLSLKDPSAKMAVIAEASDKASMKSSSKSHGAGLPSDYWEVIPHDEDQEEIDMKANRRVLSPSQVYSMLRDVSPEFLEVLFKSKSSIFLNCLIVTPNSHRITEFGQHMIFDERNQRYKRLVDFKGTSNDLSRRVLESIQVSKLRPEKSTNNDSAAIPSGSKYMKELLLAKRSDHAFRMVVVGDPYIKLSEVGVPWHIAERLKVSEVLNRWNWDKLLFYCELMILGKGQISVRRDGDLVCLRSIDEVKLGDTVHRPLRDGDIVLINRPPSIHQHSLIALSVKILPINFVLSINPLICSPLRGDFDGDCLHGYVPQSVDAKVELRELVSLDEQLIDGQNGQNLLSIGHDSLTSACLLLEDGVVMNQSQMQQLQMFSGWQLQSPGLTKENPTQTGFWTGNQLFSLLLPSDFSYEFPPNNVLVRDGQLVSSCNGTSWLRDAQGNIFYAFAKMWKQHALSFLYNAQEALCEWLSNRGLSVSLADLYLSSDANTRQNMLEDVSRGLREAQLHSYIRLLMVDGNQDFLSGNCEDQKNLMNCEPEFMHLKQQTSAALSQVSVAAFKQVFFDVQCLAYSYADKNNSLMAMLKAGSKGNLLKLVQQAICLGLQQSLVPLSFALPHQLSCAAWNNHKDSTHRSHAVSGYSKSYIPCGLIKNSFLTGLNPLECFVHALTTRDSSFSGHADVSGSLHRRLMYFMRDLYIAYDGTVRNAYGNQLVQFCYQKTNYEISNTANSKDLDESSIACDIPGGHPVGVLAACAVSEAAYSALDQPFSALESSPLLNLKKALECGVKRASGNKTATLYLSKKLARKAYGFEHGALEVQSHLERLWFSDIVSNVTICFSPEMSSRDVSPWVCHFHISKEVAEKKALKLHSVINALNLNYNNLRMKSKVHFPILQITNRVCSEDEFQGERAQVCITVSISERLKNDRSSAQQLDLLRDMVVPFLLGTLVKGFSELKKVDILWRDEPKCSDRTGEIYLRVSMSEKCDNKILWNVVMDSCLPIWDMIDWDRSHPDDIHDTSQAFGVDVALNYFFTELKFAVADTGKKILPEHMVLVGNCLTTTGKFVSLNVKGFADQRKNTSTSSPFSQACFMRPEDCFIKAAKMGVTDNLEGTVDALSWGRKPPLGTGFQFDLIYAGKGYEPAKPTDVYSLLRTFGGSQKETAKVESSEQHSDTSSRSLAENPWLSEKLRTSLTLDTIRYLSRELRRILYKYDDDGPLSDSDKHTVLRALRFHPRERQKLGSGAHEIKVGYHSKYEGSRCFFLVRTDGSVEDFSYLKCIDNALKIIDPVKAKQYYSKWLNGRK